MTQLISPKVQRQFIGYFRLDHEIAQLKNTPNVAISIEFETLRQVVSSATEVEIDNTQTSVQIWYFL